VRRASGPKRLSSALVGLLLTGCAIALPPPHAAIEGDARRVVDRLTERWQEFHDLRALADITLKRGSDRQRVSGVLLARAPASVRFEALSPFGQPFLFVAMHEGRIEPTRYPRNPLDVLAQQMVAMVAMDDWNADELFATVGSRGAAEGPAHGRDLAARRDGPVH